jgi:hypothetical protein
MLCEKHGEYRECKWRECEELCGMNENIWNKRRKILKKNSWTYDKRERTWDSPNGCSEYIEDIKLMTSEEFEQLLEN